MTLTLASLYNLIVNMFLTLKMLPDLSLTSNLLSDLDIDLKPAW